LAHFLVTAANASQEISFCLKFSLSCVKKLFEMARGNKARSQEESEKMKKKEAQTKALDGTANSKKKDSVTSLDATRAAVAKSSKFSSANKFSISEQVIPSNKTKLSEHSKEIQAKRRAQKQSRSIVESDDESVEVMESFDDEKDSKPAASTAFDVAVDYGDDKFFQNY